MVSLVEPTYAKGVGNGIGAYLFGGGYKHFDIEGFIKVVEAQDWKDLAKVQLWVKGAEEGMGEDPFTLIKLKRRRASRPDRKAKGSARSTPKIRTKGKGP